MWCVLLLLLLCVFVFLYLCALLDEDKVSLFGCNVIMISLGNSLLFQVSQLFG